VEDWIAVQAVCGDRWRLEGTIDSLLLAGFTSLPNSSLDILGRNVLSLRGNFLRDLSSVKSRMMDKMYVAICLAYDALCANVTDRQTDGRAQSINQVYYFSSTLQARFLVLQVSRDNFNVCYSIARKANTEWKFQRQVISNPITGICNSQVGIPGDDDVTSLGSKLLVRRTFSRRFHDRKKIYNARHARNHRVNVSYNYFRAIIKPPPRTGGALSDTFVWRLSVWRLSRTLGLSREQRGLGRPKLAQR